MYPKYSVYPVYKPDFKLVRVLKSHLTSWLGLRSLLVIISLLKTRFGCLPVLTPASYSALTRTEKHTANQPKPWLNPHLVFHYPWKMLWMLSMKFLEQHLNRKVLQLGANSHGSLWCVAAAFLVRLHWLFLPCHAWSWLCRCRCHTPNLAQIVLSVLAKS